jgi:chemotaxis protein methyltransferase CheR
MSEPGASAAAMAVLGGLLEARTGQKLAANRCWRLETALKPLLRERGLPGLDALTLALADGSGAGLADQVVDALLNNESSFFRDAPVFDAVADVLAERAAAERGRLRVWSAGCSTGQEPYSLVMLLAERVEAGTLRELPEIVASDVSDTALVRARAGRFSQFEIQRGLPVRRMLRWFDTAGDDWVAKSDLVRPVAFRRHNLASDAAPGRFDVVLCRNVLMYFGPEVRRRALATLAAGLKPGGVLVLGAGETVIGQSDALAPSRRFRGLYEQAAAASVPPRRLAG